jgi:hypothetical protein
VDASRRASPVSGVLRAGTSGSAFSSKGRGFCSSCGGRRMTEPAAHLVEYEFPDVPVRQWVLSLPPRVRYSGGCDNRPMVMDGVFTRDARGEVRFHVSDAVPLMHPAREPPLPLDVDGDPVWASGG